MMLNRLLLLIACLMPLAAHAAPWSVPTQQPVEMRKLTFVNDGATISGTLYAPAGGRNLPAVIAFHGASAPSQDHPLYSHLKTMLPPLGVAVFVYDRRGTGASSGDDARKTDFDVLASDGVAALAMLAKQPQIDGKRIGFWGLSQGGWLSLLAAEKEPRAAFAISVSAPMAGADVQMNFAVANVMRIKGYPPAEIDAAIKARTTVDDYVMGKGDRASAVAADASARQQRWWRESYLSGNLDDPTWKGQMTADPLKALDGSRVPTLMIYGQDDLWVPVAPSLKALAASNSRHPQLTLRVIDGADHAMALGVDPKEQIDPKFFGQLQPNAPAYYALLASWLTERGVIAPVR